MSYYLKNEDNYYNDYDDYRENESRERKHHNHCDENESEGTQSHVHEFLGSTKLA